MTQAEIDPGTSRIRNSNHSTEQSTGDQTIHLKTIHLTPFNYETSYCHGRVRVRVRVSVWVRVSVRVWVRIGSGWSEKSREIICREVKSERFCFASSQCP